jgi:hypothetical protein
MRLRLAAALLLSSTMLAGAQDAPREFPARLLGHALLPANTLVPAPADAPADLKVSGKFTTPGKRVEQIGTVPGLSGGRPTGLHPLRRPAGAGLFRHPLAGQWRVPGADR